MPSFDSGFYQLTALIPLLSEDADPRLWSWQRRSSTPVHSLRELLDSFRSVDVATLEGENCGGMEVLRAIPFSASDRTHFARLVVVEDLAYNGRKRNDTLIDLLRGGLLPERLQRLIPALRLKDREVPDQLPCSYLLVLLDFDSPDGSQGSVESYLRHLWQSMEQEWTLILRHCQGFDLEPPGRRVQSFLELILHYEIETTFGFAAYRWGAQQARRWQPRAGRFLAPQPATGSRVGLIGLLPVLLVALGAVILPVLLLLIQVVQALLGIIGLHWQVPHPLWLGWVPLGSVLLGVLLLPVCWQLFLSRANRPWSAEPGTDLRSVLKALYLQERFQRMAEAWQNRPAAGLSLRDHYHRFLQEERPHDLGAPTLMPGEIHTIRRRSQP